MTKHDDALPAIIAGALFDLMGYLTCRDERLTLSARDEAGPAVEALTAWAKLRGLSLDDARVQDWRDALAARGEEPQRVQCPQCRGSGVGEYVYHGHGPDSIEPIRCDKCDGFGWLAAPPAPSQANEAMRLMRDCIADLDDDDGHGCPGHDHQVARLWDDTGEPCAACTRWDALRALLREGAGT